MYMHGTVRYLNVTLVTALLRRNINAIITNEDTCVLVIVYLKSNKPV